MFLRLYTGAQTWWSDFRTRMGDEEGATAVEYALMLALIAAVIIGAVTILGQNSNNQFTTIGNAVGGAGS
jgi:pilus assembly protein Flp/PilA